MNIRVSLIIPLVFFFSVITTYAETINLSIAASMTDAIKEIIVAFAKTHPNAKLQPNFGSSGSLAKQISQGAPADIYISANPQWMKYLVEEKMIAPGTDKIFAFNKLVFISDTQTSELTLQDIVNLERIAIGNPKYVPAGRYAEQAMETAGVYTTLKEGKKLILAKDVRQALLYADRGEVDGAFVYKTDALLARNAKIFFTVPEHLYNRVSYPLGLTSSGADKEMAKALFEYINSAEAAAILTTYGFEPSNK